MAARILANLIVMGSGIMARALFQAYRQALANASKSGVAQETVQNAARSVSKALTHEEARQILGVTERSTWEEIVQKYNNLFEKNAKNGSFYLQSKVHRAKESLESLYGNKTQGPPINASKSGVAQETVQNAARSVSKALTHEEARQILGVTERSTWEEIVQKYNNLFEKNAKNGSFYLQSKVHRAKESLESLYGNKTQGPPIS